MSENGNTPRARVLALFRGEDVDPLPVFSGMGNVTLHGLADEGWRFAEVHVDAHKMASVAASTHQLFGFECVVVPFDMGVEAEVLGCGINFYAHSDQEVLYPTIASKLSAHVEDLALTLPDDIQGRGRVPLVTEAIQRLKAELGDRVAVGSWVLGPFTLAGQITELDYLLKASFKKPALVNELLSTLGDFLVRLVAIYKEAGADYITVREMGATSDVLSPRMFKSLVQPHLQRVFAAIGSPSVLHICGDTDPIIELMADCGADAISVDQKNDLARTVATVGDRVLVFGNLDPFNVLSMGTPDQVRESVTHIVQAGAHALWPGCDIWPSVPVENLQALMQTARRSNTSRSG